MCVDKRNKNPEEIFIPLEVIESYGKNLIAPSKDEGFSEIYIIKYIYKNKYLFKRRETQILLFPFVIPLYAGQ